VPVFGWEDAVMGDKVPVPTLRTIYQNPGFRG
jgi:hypothetical protein